MLESGPEQFLSYFRSYSRSSAPKHRCSIPIAMVVLMRWAARVPQRTSTTGACQPDAEHDAVDGDAVAKPGDVIEEGRWRRPAQAD